jgi:amino acid adenylation domain-containing protein
MVEDSGSTIFVCRSETRAAAEEMCPPGGRILDLDQDHAWIESMPSVGPDHVRAPEDAAYLIFTSGSTGRPKGVIVETRNLDHLGKVFDGFEGVSCDDRVLMFASLSFDAGVAELVQALMNGACLVAVPAAELRDPDISALLNRHSVTFATLPPQLFEVADRDDIPALKILMSAGDVLRGDYAERWLGPWHFLNVYGPTEGTVIATSMRLDEESATRPPIGFPVRGVTIHLLDSDMRPVDDGEVGEIYIGGTGVARGYIGDPVRTAEKFVRDPFSADPEARMYRTGDLGIRSADGCLEFRGRADRQVQIRGHRVEPAEIESHLVSLAGIKQAAVTPTEHDGSVQLAAFVIGDDKIDTTELRATLRSLVPEYLIPTSITQIGQIPVTPAGKRDDRALRQLLDSPLTTEDNEDNEDRQTPASDLEQRISHVWSEVLGRPNIKPDDDFFEIGGNSLTLIKICQKLGQLDISISVQDAYSSLTPRDQARLVLSLDGS